MKCIHCSAEIPENANFCPVCGQNSSKQPNFCMNCGSKVEWNMQFCENCGKPIEKLTQEEEKPEIADDVKEAIKKIAENAEEVPAAQVPVQAQPIVKPAANAVASATAQLGAEVVRTTGKVAVEGVKKTVSTGKKIAIIAAVAVFIIGALTACLNFFVSSPEDTVENFFASVEELDYEKMLGCMDKTTESTIRAAMGLTGDLLGSFTGISLDLEDIMALGPALAPSVDTPDLGEFQVETVFYSDCSQQKIIEYCIEANLNGYAPEGYDPDNAIMSFLSEYKLALPGLENLVAKTAIVKLTVDTGEAMYLPLINEGWGDWRIPLMAFSMAMEGM